MVDWRRLARYAGHVWWREFSLYNPVYGRVWEDTQNESEERTSRKRDRVGRTERVSRKNKLDELTVFWFFLAKKILTVVSMLFFGLFSSN